MPTGIGGELAWWCPSLDDAGNGTATLHDLVGSANGTLTNMDAATDWVADTANGGVRALDFDGLNDQCRSGSLLSSITGDLFCCAWINPSGTKDDAGILITRNVLTGASRNGFALYFRDGAANNIAFEVVHSGIRHTAKVNATLTNGVWYFVYGLRSVSTGEVKVGVAGIGEATAPTTTVSAITHEVTPTIGSFRDWNAFPGRIDDARVFTRLPSTTEIASLASKRGYLPTTSVRRRRNIGSHGL